MGNDASSPENSDDNVNDQQKGDQLLKLNRIQMRQTRKLWKSAHHNASCEPGRSILLSLLLKAPTAARIFNFSDDPGARTPGHHGTTTSVTLNEHAKRFNNEIDFMIVHLHEPAVAAEHFQALGSRHIIFQTSGFTTRLWDVFADCMIEKTVEWGVKSQRNTSSQEAWGKIVLFIIDNMKTGYYDALKASRRKSNLSVDKRSISSEHYLEVSSPNESVRSLPAATRLTVDSPTVVVGPHHQHHSPTHHSDISSSTSGHNLRRPLTPPSSMMMEHLSITPPGRNPLPSHSIISPDEEGPRFHRPRQGSDHGNYLLRPSDGQLTQGHRSRSMCDALNRASEEPTTQYPFQAPAMYSRHLHVLP